MVLEARGLDFLAPALAHSDYFVLNYEEGRQLTGYEAPNDIFDTSCSRPRLVSSRSRQGRGGSKG